MSKKQTRQTIEHEHLLIQVTLDRASVGGTINHEIHDSRRAWDGARVYSMTNRMELRGQCLYPEDREGHHYQITIYGEYDADQFDAELSAFSVKDKDGARKLRKRGDQYTPLYDPPTCIGFLNRQRGAKAWRGSCWLPAAQVASMTTMALLSDTLYISLHEIKMGRQHNIRGLSLDTKDPDAD